MAVPDYATHLKDRQETFVHRVDIGQLTTVSHPEHVIIAEEHTAHVKQSGNVDNQVSKDNTPTQQAELSQKQQHGLALEPHSENADSDMYLGSPPLYLPVLDKTGMMVREKEVNQEGPVSTAPSAPKLAKTVLEISEKIVQTRERIKNETIDWKKCVLFKLEKRLIQKLRRAERFIGQRTEIEDLRDEVPGQMTKGKKGRFQSQRKRSSRKESQPESPESGEREANRVSTNEKKKIEENPTFENEMRCNYSTEEYSNDQNDKISSAQEKNTERSIRKFELDQGERCNPGVKKKSRKRLKIKWTHVRNTDKSTGKQH